jgi:DNA-3-methyladenine glycosylase
MKKLRRSFFIRSTLTVAKDLLGKYLVREVDGKIISGKIVETEAYIGTKDKASHAFNGKITLRNQAEYLIGGHVYIYLVYGMYWQLNITTNTAGKPECVLIRALEIENQNPQLANGPGKLCQYLHLDKSFYGEDLTKSKRLWIEDKKVVIKNSQIMKTARIGIGYAGPVWSEKPWRFYIKGNHAISHH